MRGECKHTSKSTFILKEAELLKIKMEALTGGFEDWVMQVEFLGAVGRSKKFAILDWRMFMDMWTTYYPTSPDDPFMTQSSICQIGKSFQLKLSNTVGNSGVHLIQLAFADGTEKTQPKSDFVIAPWQTYLDVRKAYLERDQ